MWKSWLKGAALAAAGAALAASTSAVNNRLQNGPQAPPLTGANIGMSAGVGALLAVLGYLVQSPLPAGTQPTVAPPVG